MTRVTLLALLVFGVGCQEGRNEDTQPVRGGAADDAGSGVSLEDDAEAPELDAGATGQDGSAAQRDAALDASTSARLEVDAAASAPFDAGLQTSPADAAGAAQDATSAGPIKLAFSPMYSAYDGQHVYKIPLRVQGASGRLTVSTTPAGLVDAVPATFGVMLTTRKAGSGTVLVADEAGHTGAAPLRISQANLDEYALGAARYHAAPGGGDAGLADGGIDPKAQSCAFCHSAEPVAVPSTGTSDVELTPQQTAGYDDSELVTILTLGMKPPGTRFRVVNGGGALPDSIAARVFANFHAWTLDGPTGRGLVAYLRGLEPKAQGAIDFGGVFSRAP